MFSGSTRLFRKIDNGQLSRPVNSAQLLPGSLIFLWIKCIRWRTGSARKLTPNLNERETRRDDLRQRTPTYVRKDFESQIEFRQNMTGIGQSKPEIIQ